MDTQLLETIRARYAKGARITRLAKEAGVSWQWLWGVLNDKTTQGDGQTPPQPQPRQQQPQRSRSRRQSSFKSNGSRHGGCRFKNRYNRTEGQLTPANAVQRGADGIDRIAFECDWSGGDRRLGPTTHRTTAILRGMVNRHFE